MNKPKILAKLLLSVTLWACSTEIEIKDEKQPLKAQKQTKNIHFKGLEVKHRFSMPAKYLDDKTETKFTSQVAQKLYTLSDYRLEDIAEVTEEVFKRFPNPSEDKNFKVDYKMISQDFPKLTAQQIKKNDSLIARYYAINLDYEVLQILKKTKKPIQKKDNNLKQLGASYGTYGYGNPPPTNVDCSGVPIPTDENTFRFFFYNPCKQKNFAGSVTGIAGGMFQAIPCVCIKKEYPKLQPIWEQQRRGRIKNAMNKCTPKRGGWRLKGKPLAAKVGVLMALSKYGLVSVATVACALKKSLDAHSKYKSRIILYDAVKHMYWQMLLCKYYSPIFRAGDKSYRMDFAKEVGNLYEIWKVNHADDTVMDLHNNEVGRNIWEKDTNSWDVGWWIFKTIHTVYDYKLLEAAKDAYHGRKGYKKVQIVHEEIIKIKRNKSEWRYPEYDTIRFKETDINICNRKYWILNAAKSDRPVETYENQR